MKKIFIISLFLILLLVPAISLAGTYKLTDDTEVQFTGFVPCGKAEAGPGESDGVTMPCQLCHIFIIFKEIIIFLLIPGEINGGLPIILLIVLLMIIYGGILLFFSSGNPEIINKGKGVLKSTGIALLIIYGAWIFIGFFLTAIGAVELVDLPSGWFQINCPIKPSIAEKPVIPSERPFTYCSEDNQTFTLDYEIVNNQVIFKGCNTYDYPRKIRVWSERVVTNHVCLVHMKANRSYICPPIPIEKLKGRYYACRSWWTWQASWWSGSCPRNKRSNYSIEF